MCPEFPLNVAQHKIFRGKLSFVDKEMDEKSRVGELSTEEIHEIVDNAVSGTINKARKFRALVAQLVEHRAATREVVSSTPSGPFAL